MPPSPPVMLSTVVQSVPLSETSSVYAVANAGSQVSLISEIDDRAPRSSVSVCGSANALDQRVVVSPSMALDAGNAALSSDVAVATALRGRFPAAGSAPERDGATSAAAARTAKSAIRRIRASPPGGG